MLNPENNQHLPDLSWLVASGDSIRSLKVKFCLSTSFLLKATAAIPFCCDGIQGKYVLSGPR